MSTDDSRWWTRRLARAASGALAVWLAGAGCAVWERPLAAPGAGLGSSRELTLPARLDDDMFFVEAYIGTNGPLRLLVDTGASCLVITPEVAERVRQAGLFRDTRDGRAGTASGEKVTLEFAEVKDVRIGGWMVPRARTAVVDFQLFSKVGGARLDGIAGMALFASGTLVLDYPQRAVRMEPARDWPVSGAVVVPCRYRRHVPMARLEVADWRYAATVDSGYNGGFHLPAWEGGLPFTAPPVVAAASVSLDGLTEGSYARLATNVQWGGLSFTRPIVQTARRGSALIGGAVLKHFVVRVDQRRRELRLTPATDGPVESPSMRSLGMSVAREDLGLKVMAVAPNTDAAGAGIRSGDFVTTINGEPARAWTPRRLRTLRESRQEFEVELRRGEETRSVKLKVNTMVE